MRVHVQLDADARGRISRCATFYGHVSLSSLVRRALALLDSHLGAIEGDPAGQTIEKARFHQFTATPGRRRSQADARS